MFGDCLWTILSTRRALVAISSHASSLRALREARTFPTSSSAVGRACASLYRCAIMYQTMCNTRCRPVQPLMPNVEVASRCDRGGSPSTTGSRGSLAVIWRVYNGRIMYMMAEFSCYRGERHTEDVGSW
jgi:hypothetical protein